MTPTRGQVTLKTLATELGLSPSTVSRVLNNPGEDASRWASPETAARIVELAGTRGYKRNPYATSLRTAQSNMVGVIVPRLQDYVLATIYEGIDESATSLGYLTMVSNSLDDAGIRRSKVERVLDHRVDGLVFGDALLDQVALFDELKRREVPHTLVSRWLPGHVSVTCDDREGGRLMAEHLLAVGCERFAMLAGKLGTSTSLDRSEGFADTLRARGIDDSRITVIHGGFDTPAGRQMAEQLLAASPLPDAIFTANDFAAIGALGALQARGIRVPEDIMLAGYNDTPLAAGIGLTSIRSPMHEMGRRGFELLTELLGGQHPESERLQPDLVVRGSTTAGGNR